MPEKGDDGGVVSGTNRGSAYLYTSTSTEGPELLKEVRRKSMDDTPQKGRGPGGLSCTIPCRSSAYLSSAEEPGVLLEEKRRKSSCASPMKGRWGVLSCASRSSAYLYTAEGPVVRKAIDN